MNRLKKHLILMGIILGMAVLGCGQKIQNSEEESNLANAKAAVEAKVQYLIEKAKSLVKSDRFDETVEAAKYDLTKINAKFVAAQVMMENFMVNFKKYADQKIAEAKGKFKSFRQ